MSAENLFGSEDEQVALDADLETAETTEDGLIFLTVTLALCPTLIPVSIYFEC